MYSQEFFGGECAKKRVRGDPLEIVSRVNSALRESGVRVSAAELALFAVVLDNYAALRGGKTTVADVAVVAAATIAKRDPETVTRAVVEAFCGSNRVSVEASISSDLRRLSVSPGSRVRLHAKSMRLDQREAYLRLRLVGVIRRGRGGEYVVSRRVMERIAREVAASGGYIEAARRRLQNPRYMAWGASLLGENILDYLDLGSMSVDGLLSLYRFIGGQAGRARVASTIALRIDGGELPNSGVEQVVDILKRHNLLTPERAVKLAAASQRAASRLAKIVGREVLLDTAERIAESNPRLAAMAAASLLGLGSSSVEAFEEARMHGVSFSEAAKNLEPFRRLATVRKSIQSYFETLDTAYLDMARSELERVRGEGSVAAAIRRYEELISAIDESGSAPLAQLIRPERGFDEFTVFSMLYSIYRSARANGRRGLERVVAYLISRVWRIAVSRAGLRLARRRVQSTVGDRVDVRATVMRMARLDFNVVWTERRHLKRLVLLLDKSGSMRRYSFYALAAAASLSPIVDRVVLFDVKPILLRRLPKSPLRLAEILLSSEFEGYTDIASAVSLAAKSLPPRHIVIVSDLKQTVAPLDAHIEALEAISRRGWKITVLTPDSSSPWLGRLRARVPRARIYLVNSVDKLHRAINSISLQG